MKKSFSILLISVVSLSMFMVSCTKYNDGPAFSLRSAAGRLTGDWLIESFSMNGTDITAAYQLLAGANFKLIFEKNGTYSVEGNLADHGTWELGGDKDDVRLTSSASGSVEVSYRILRLTNKEMWLKHTESNGDIELIHYKAEED